MSNSGFIQLQRSFFQNSIWLSLPTDYRSIFMVILVNCAWKEIEMDDFGKKITLKPGQLLMTEREIIAQAFPPTTDSKLLDKHKSMYRRAIKKFKNLGFSYHGTYQRKTLHTILRTDIFNTCVPSNEPNSYQTRTIKEEQQESKNTKEQPQPLPVVVFSCLEKLSDKDVSYSEKIRLTKKHIQEEQIVIDAVECIIHPSFVPQETLLKSLRAAIKGKWKPSKCSEISIHKNKELALKLEKIKHSYQFNALNESLEIVKGPRADNIMYQMSEEEFIKKVESQGKINLSEIFIQKGIA